MESKIYQWSIKLDNGEIFVIHSDTITDLKLKREELMIFIESNFTTDLGGLVTKEPDFEKEMDQIAEVCAVHKVAMKPNKNGKLYHREFANGKVRFCNGYAWSEWK